jgi:hypothetical protein
MTVALSSRARPDAPAATAPPEAAPAARSDALDRLRGVALVAMVVHHVTDWLTGDARAVLPGWRAFSLTDAAAVAFFVAAGASAALFVRSRRRHGMPRIRVAAQVARRYGTLVPIGIALDWLLWRDPAMVGVLEVLGVAVVVGAGVAAVAPQRLLPSVAVAVVAAGILAERAVAGWHVWVGDEVIGGKFPLVTYVGFVLLGIAAVRSGWYADRRRVFAAAAVAMLATLALLADDIVPARYPGDVPFVVPGLAVTILVFALGQARWPARRAALDRVVRRAAAHTLGIFVGHYLVYGGLRWRGWLGAVDGIVAVPIAVVVTVVACLVAPRVPRLPWSFRTGRGHPRSVRADRVVLLGGYTDQRDQSHELP